MSDEDTDAMGNEEFVLDLSDTKLRPFTLLELLKDFGYNKESMDNNGWELDFWINIRKAGSFPSTSQSLCIHGCGMTFELMLSVKEFMN